MRKVPQRKEQLENEGMSRVIGYFEGSFKPATHDKEVYFCSELITSAFIEAGIIGESASILISHETLSPQDIAKDKIFGLFIGYIKPYEGYEISEDEQFQTSI